MLHGTIVLDPGCTINLYASGRMGDILQACDADFVIEGCVLRKEAVAIGVAEGSAEGREPIMTDILLAHSRLHVVELEFDGEASTYLALAPRQIQDGEARSAAIAVHRGFMLATDGQRTRELLALEFPLLPILGTATLVAQWARTSRPPRAELQSTLQAIQKRSKFKVPSWDPEFTWWKEALIA